MQKLYFFSVYWSLLNNFKVRSNNRFYFFLSLSYSFQLKFLQSRKKNPSDATDSNSLYILTSLDIVLISINESSLSHDKVLSLEYFSRNLNEFKSSLN